METPLAFNYVIDILRHSDDNMFGANQFPIQFIERFPSTIALK